MNVERLRELSGLLTEDKTIPVGLHFTLNDQGNMKAAVDALLEAGLSVDLSFSMGTYYFNFKNESVVAEARKIVSKVINKKKEANKWGD